MFVSHGACCWSIRNHRSNGFETSVKWLWNIGQMALTHWSDGFEALVGWLWSIGHFILRSGGYVAGCNGNTQIFISYEFCGIIRHPSFSIDNKLCNCTLSTDGCVFFIHQHPSSFIIRHYPSVSVKGLIIRVLCKIMLTDKFASVSVLGCLFCW